MSTQDAFADGLQYLQEHVSELRKSFTEGPKASHHLLEIAFETMHSTLEELRVAEEEMRQQNEALVASHDTIETWRRHYQDLFESAPDAYLVTDLGGVIQEANQPAAELLGLSKRFLKGKPLTAFVPEDARREFRAFVTDLTRVGETTEREMRLIPRKSGPLEVAVTVSAVRDGYGRPTALRWLVRDNSGGLEAETERYRQLVEEVDDYAIFLMDTGGHVLNWNSGAARILGYAAAEIRGRHFEILFPSEARHQEKPRRELEKAEAEGRAEDVGWHVRKDGSRFWANGVTTAMRDKAGHLRWYAKVMRDDTARKQEEERLAEVYQREHRIAETLQRALLPELKVDAFPGLAVATQYEAAWAEAQIGGDFFDAFSLDGGRVALIVGDVSGKGLAAAAHTAEAKYLVRAALRETFSPARALARMNVMVYDRHRLSAEEASSFVTLCVLVVQPETGETVVSTAGAEPPLLLCADGTVEPIAVCGPLLGLARDADYAAVTLTLFPGDTIIVATDGLTEARRGSDFLDYEGLMRLVEQARGQATLTEMGRAIMDGAQAFSGGALADDACLLLARRV